MLGARPPDRRPRSTSRASRRATGPDPGDFLDDIPPLFAHAQIKVGITLAATGPAASLGIPQKNTVSLLPKTIGGKTVEYLVLDDASDTTTAVKNARKLISDDNVDVMIGSSTTPNSLAIVHSRKFGEV